MQGSGPGFGYVITLFITSAINVHVEGCLFENITGNIVNVSICNSSVSGTVHITNSHFKANRCTSSCIRAISNNYQTISEYCNTTLGMVTTGNTFVNNNGTIFYTSNWAIMEINNSEFRNNTAAESILNLGITQQFVPCGGIHNTTFVENTIISIATARKGSIVFIRHAIKGFQNIALSRLKFVQNIGTPLSFFNVYYLEVSGDILFRENNARIGGGIYVGNKGVLPINLH